MQRNQSEKSILRKNLCTKNTLRTLRTPCSDFQERDSKNRFAQNVFQAQAVNFTNGTFNLHNYQSIERIAKYLSTQQQKIKKGFIQSEAILSKPDKDYRKTRYIFDKRAKALGLSNWIDQRLQEIKNKSDIQINQYMHFKQVIYNYGLAQIIKNVSEKCKQQGNLLSKIINANFNIADKTIKYLFQKTYTLENKHLIELSKLHQQYQSYIQNKKKLYQELDHKKSVGDDLNRTLIQKNRFLVRGNKQLQKQTNLLLFKYETIKQNFVKLLQQNMGLSAQDGQIQEWARRRIKNIYELKKQKISKKSLRRQCWQKVRLQVNKELQFFVKQINKRFGQYKEIGQQLNSIQPDQLIQLQKSQQEKQQKIGTQNQSLFAWALIDTGTSTGALNLMQDCSSGSDKQFKQAQTIRQFDLQKLWQQSMSIQMSAIQINVNMQTKICPTFSKSTQTQSERINEQIQCLIVTRDQKQQSTQTEKYEVSLKGGIETAMQIQKMIKFQQQTKNKQFPISQNQLYDNQFQTPILNAFDFDDQYEAMKYFFKNNKQEFIRSVQMRRSRKLTKLQINNYKKVVPDLKQIVFREKIIDDYGQRQWNLPILGLIKYTNFIKNQQNFKAIQIQANNTSHNLNSKKNFSSFVKTFSGVISDIIKSKKEQRRGIQPIQNIILQKLCQILGLKNLAQKSLKQMLITLKNMPGENQLAKLFKRLLGQIPNTTQDLQILIKIIEMFLPRKQINFDVAFTKGKSINQNISSMLQEYFTVQEVVAVKSQMSHLYEEQAVKIQILSNIVLDRWLQKVIRYTQEMPFPIHKNFITINQFCQVIQFLRLGLVQYLDKIRKFYRFCDMIHQNNRIMTVQKLASFCSKYNLPTIKQISENYQKSIKFQISPQRFQPFISHSMQKIVADWINLQSRELCVLMVKTGAYIQYEWNRVREQLPDFMGDELLKVWDNIQQSLRFQRNF